MTESSATRQGAAEERGTEDRGTGRPMPCLLAGAVMLAVPTALALAASPPRSAEEADTGLAVAVVLAIGGFAVILATLRPRTATMPALAVLCTALALLLGPPEALADGVCGFACLGFLLAVRLHRESSAGPVDTAEWLAAHRPMLVGAAVTTPGAVAAAAVPQEWSLPVAAAVGVASAAACAMIFLT